MSLLCQPSISDAFERLFVDRVKLVPTVSPGFDQTGGLEHIQVLRDRLPSGGELMLHREASADLE
jgi:hypothetical protein